MTASTSASADRCSLCSLPTPDPPVTGEGAEGSFCCPGCLRVARTLGDVRPSEVDAGSDPDEATGPEAFLAVDGMHCATCEAFIEHRATRLEGVTAADASYATGLVRLVYDPETRSPEELPDLLSGAGYSFRAPEDGPGTDRTESVGRLLVGGFFAMMTMCWYALFLYPTYLGFDAVLFDLSGSAGRYLLLNVAVFAAVVLCYTGFPILRGAYVSLRAGRPNMDLLVALAATTAFVYSLGVLLAGETEVYFDVTVAIVVVVSVGSYYETRTREGALSRLTGLTEERVREARRQTSDGTETVPIDDLEPGDELVVRAGERVPVDGTVAEGTAAVDESLVTGESFPVPKAAGDDVVGGGLVTDGGLVVRVGSKVESTADRLVSALWSVQSGRPGAGRVADRLAAVFVPLVLLVALCAFVYGLATGTPASDALLTALSVLVVSCPCALGLATPLAVASGVRAGLDRGVVVTGAEVFERAAGTDTVVLDKTGTLTTGRMRVRAVHADDTDWEDGPPRTGHGRERERERAEADVLSRAAAVERFADHPLARAVVERAPDVPEATGFERHVRGVSADVDGERVTVGSPALFGGDWTVPDALARRGERAAGEGYVPAFIGWGGRVRGCILGGDEPREGWERAVDALAEGGRRVIVLTGDGEAAAERFRDHPEIDEVLAGVPPEGKAEVVERLRADGRVAMVGDGSNDAPALAAADLGVALESGTRLAADAADAVVTTGDLATVPTVFSLTRATRRRVHENLAWAFVYNLVAVPLAALGLINPLFAAAAMALSSLLVVANSARYIGPDTGPTPASDRRAPVDGEVSGA